MVIPWWAKLGGKIALARMPFGYQLWQRLGLFRHGQMDALSYVKSTFDRHIDAAGLSGKLNGKIVLELGPGDSIATALIAASCGARSVLVDSGSFAVKDVGVYKNMAQELEGLGLRVPESVYQARSLDDILTACHGEYLVNGLDSLSTIASGSVDFIFSQAVLEHVRRHEFLSTITELRRIISPDGLASHQVDLKDHLGGGLNNLRFGDAIWESDFFVRSGFYTNRIQYQQMISLFYAGGFRVEVQKLSRWDNLPINRSALAPQFHSTLDDDLLVNGFHVLLHPRVLS